MIFDYHIPVISIALFAAALACVVYIAVVYALRLGAVRRRCRECDAAPAEAPGLLPRTSVVVYASNDDRHLERNLEALLQQRFDGVYEVIVVNDGNADEADTVVTRLKAVYKNLYLTFVPDNSHNLSRKKMAITLGVKAAKGDVIVVTDGITAPGSDRWLQRMVAPFADQAVEVVLGYNTMCLEGHHRLAEFDYTADSAAWLAAAVKGSPYRGCGANIAYRKDTFFRNKGFSNSLNFKHGDDDLFVAEIARPGNTVVQLATEARGCTGEGCKVAKMLADGRRAHAFTGRRLPRASRRLMASAEWMMWAVCACAVAGALTAGVANALGWALAAALVIAMLAVVAVQWHKTGAALGARRMLLSLPLMAATRPLRNMAVALRSGSRRNSCYSWQDDSWR